MKRLGALVLSLLLSLSLLCGCTRARGEDPFSPESAEAEYARIYKDGQAFDFDTLTAFTRKSTVSLTGEALAVAKDEHGRPWYPATEVMEYKYENTDGVRSQRTLRLINMNGPFSELAGSTTEVPQFRPVYAPYSREIYSDETLVYADMMEGVQQDTAVAPQKTYESREEYLADGARNFDTPSQCAVPYDLTVFSSFTGKLEGNTYRMTGIVDAEAHGAAFFEVFLANYSFKTWYTTGGDGVRMYEYFLTPEMFAAYSDTYIKVEIVSDRNGLRSVTETFITAAAARPVLAFGGSEIELICTTEYSTDALVDPIVVPPLKTA